MTASSAIELAHGGGGRLSRELIEEEIVPRFGRGPLQGLPDAATIDSPGSRLVFTTDSYVVNPIEFPGGNIGHLAVHGTVNDLAVCGAEPVWLSLALIIEEGLPIGVLRRILDSVRAAADQCGAAIATGDTKVVGRGQCDQLFINTAGIGRALAGFDLAPARIEPGDCILVSGPIGDHGMAVLAAREKARFLEGPSSDTAPVHRLVLALGPLAASVRFMRDPTRGGVSAVLNEVAADARVGFSLRERDIPVSPRGRAVAEMLGIDLLHVASEGRVILVSAPDAAERILALWRRLPEGAQACDIGAATGERGRVILETVTGGRRLVDVPRGELLPRIC